MRINPIAMAALIVLLAIVPTSSYAMADGPDYYAVTGVKADDVLNMRAEDHYQSEKIGEIPHDAAGLKNLGCNNDDISMGVWLDMTTDERKDLTHKRWCKVEYDGNTGWVMGRYLQEDTSE